MNDPVQVECYSGHSYAQEPRTFVWQGQRRAVVAVERTWRTPSGPCFRVKTKDGSRFDLAYDEGADKWLLNTISDVRQAIRNIDKEVNLNA